MRLGQLARKCDVSAQKIISYLEEIGIDIELHPNSKLDEQTELMVAEHYGVSLQIISTPEEPLENDSSEVVENISSPEVTEISTPISANGLEEQDAQNEPENSIPEESINKSDKGTEEESIETDKLIELIESEDAPVDLSKITHIKAPKKELSGLKVVGKIELPEPKVKDKEKSEVVKKDSNSNGNQRTPRKKYSEEELEKRRLRAKKKKADYEIRQEIRKKKEAAKRIKAKKEAHYQQKMKQIKADQNLQKKRKQKQKIQEENPQTTTIFGKFWKWFNT